MHQLTVGLWVTACIVLYGCKDPKEYEDISPIASLPMTVEAMEVLKLPPPNGRTLFGRFEIRFANKGELFVSPGTTGGACLLTQFDGVPKTCTKSSQCNYVSPNPSPAGGNKIWLGYCLRDQDSLPGDLATNSCWVRPGPDTKLCLKGAELGRHYTPYFDTAPVYREAARRPDKTVRWMVYGCLNGPYDENNLASKGCAGGPYPAIHDQGAIATVP